MMQLVNVSRTFFAGRAVAALQEVNLRIRPNDYVGILGPSGSGKSTLLHLIAAMDAPTEGEIRVRGKSSTSSPYVFPSSRRAGSS